MLIKYDTITGKIIGLYPEAMMMPPGTVGRINIYEDGKLKHDKPNQIRSCLVIGTKIQQFLTPNRKVEFMAKARIKDLNDGTFEVIDPQNKRHKIKKLKLL